MRTVWTIIFKPFLPPMSFIKKKGLSHSSVIHHHGMWGVSKEVLMGSKQAQRKKEQSKKRELAIAGETGLRSHVDILNICSHV